MEKGKHAARVDEGMPFVTAEKIAQMVQVATDDQLEQGLEANRQVILGEIFRRMVEHLRTDRARDVQAVVEWRIRDASGGHDRWQVSIDRGTCAVTRGGDEQPRVTFTLGPVDFLKLVTGNISGPQLFLFGRLKIEGDLFFASRVPSLFSLPAA